MSLALSKTLNITADLFSFVGCVMRGKKERYLSTFSIVVVSEVAYGAIVISLLFAPLCLIHIVEKSHERFDVNFPSKVMHH